MLRFLFKRFLYGGVVVVLVAVIISSIIYLAPVDPARLTFGQRSDTATVEAKREELGLDKGLFWQLKAYLNDLSPLSIYTKEQLQSGKYTYTNLFSWGDKYLILKYPYLRTSFQTGAPVSQILLAALPKTIILAIAAILIAILIGIPLGILAALKQNTFVDHVAVTASVAGISLPSYVSAILLALIFGYYLNEWTGLNVRGSIYDLDEFGDEAWFFKNLILPAIALGIRPVAIVTQLTRSSMLEVLSQDYIRTAKAKGLSQYKIVFKHALRNALNPVLTAISGWFAALLAGAFFVENVFDFSGLGQVTVHALLAYDIPVVLGAVILTSILFVMINILVDIMYVWLDPRVKAQ